MGDLTPSSDRNANVFGQVLASRPESRAESGIVECVPPSPSYSVRYSRAVYRASIFISSNPFLIIGLPVRTRRRHVYSSWNDL